jgi:hypothetical protein
MDRPRGEDQASHRIRAKAQSGHSGLGRGTAHARPAMERGEPLAAVGKGREDDVWWRASGFDAIDLLGLTRRGLWDSDLPGTEKASVRRFH